MGNIIDSMFQFIFLAGCIILFLVSMVILKPLRKHRRRRESTIFLKISYLAFLASFLVFTYILLFGAKDSEYTEQPYTTLFSPHFLFFLTAAVIPNVGIIVRRKILKKRSEYNIVVGIINVIYFSFLTYLCVSGKWAAI